MSTRMYGPEERAKLARLITEGPNILRAVEDFQEGLKETVKAVAVLSTRQLKLPIKIIGNLTKKNGTKLK